MRILIISLFVSAVCFGQTWDIVGYENMASLSKLPMINTASLKLSWPNSDQEPITGEVRIPIGNKDIPWYPVYAPISAFDTIPKPTTMDTLKAPLISILEVQDFLFSINRKIVAMRELDLIKENEYKQLVAELNKVVAVLEKKKKTFK